MDCNIYYLTDETNIPRYVGKTIRPLNVRLYFHIYDSDKLTHKNNWINKVGKDNITIHLIEVCDYSISDDREQYWIKNYDNLTNCGEHYGSGNTGKKYSGRQHTEETKKKISESRKNNWKHFPMSDEGKKSFIEKTSGQKRTDETKNKMSKSQKGKKISDDIKLKISKTMTGVKKSSEFKLKMIGNKNKLGKNKNNNQ